MRATLGATALFGVAAAAAAAVPEQLATPVAVLDVVLFGAGLGAFTAALVAAAARSRHEELTVSGLFLLTGSAPAPVRRALLGALAVQTVVALATASARPFTPLAFGILVPTLGLGACGLWAARHGTFPPRPPSRRTAARGAVRRPPPGPPTTSARPAPGARGGSRHGR